MAEPRAVKIHNPAINKNVPKHSYLHSTLSACCSTAPADTATTIHLSIFSMRFTKSARAAPFSFISRRLRPSGSVKGAKSSAFFTITGRKRGGAFDSHEPSSPKVTCIGQVRVKSKKRVKQCRRRIGEVSFRTTEQSHHHGGGGGLIEDRDKVWIRSQRLSSSSVHSHREQRWVHLPISVCEALRAFRDEICCFLPCGCSCFSREREKDTERDYFGGERENGCGAVLARWLGAADGGEDESRREIAVVVGGDEEVMSIRSSRRHVFEDVVVNDEEEEEEEARVSICIPPKNALLLMRCRSDPMKMASLANRFSLDLPKIEIDFEEHEGKDVISVAEIETESNLEEMEVRDNDCEEGEEKEEEIEENEPELIEKVAESDISSFGIVSEQEDTQNVSEEKGRKKEEEDGDEDEETEELERETKDEEEKPIELERENPETTFINPIKENKSSSLPDCLLLMMCEPKLSMEVSKETWVRGTDFIRLLPERPRKPAKTAAAAAADHELVKRRPSIDSKCKPRVPAPPKKNEQQPARSSCSLPAASMAAVNQVSARKCEPFSLTRCKSEPMSTAAAKLMPESCCWKNNSGMKMEPHRQAALGVGAAGVGF